MNDSLYTYSLELAGVPLAGCFRFEKTTDHFGEYITSPSADLEPLIVGDWEWSNWPQTGKPVDAFAEYSLYVYAASTALLAYHRCAIHAAAFRWRDRAYLIAAEPGVGKSTQVRNLQELHPGEFSVICGDKPILELREDKSIIVHPSPWNGKENWHGADAAPLGGVILLSRGEKNSIEPLTAPKAALSLYFSLIHSGETEENIRAAADIASAILNYAPAWQMTTYQVPDSTKILYNALISQGDKDYEL